MSLASPLVISMRRPATILSCTLILLLPAGLAGQSSSAGTPETQVRQWAVSATASSEGADAAASQATGPPNSESCARLPTAWGHAFAVHFGTTKQWIELTYAIPVHAVRVRARENNAPGSVYQVDLKDPAGALHTVWTGSDKTQCLGWFEVEIPRTPYLVSGVKLYTKKVGTEQIDAVELIGELQATLSISAAPAGSQVFLDDKPLGAVAPDGSFRAIVAPGRHHVKLTAAGYDDWRQEVTLKEDASVNLEARMTRPAADLVLLTQPGVVSVYLDDEPRGVTSSEGRLILKGLKPGSYRLRLALTGYKEWTRAVTLAAGEVVQTEATLEKAGPKPLTLADVEQALTGGLGKARVIALVEEFGVDFTLSDEAEKQLRAAGADSDLLLIIAKAKK